MNSIPQDDTPQKQCTKCLQWFPATLEFFHKRSRGGLRPSCKKCRNQENKAYRDADPEYHKRYYQNHREVMLADAACYRAIHHEEILIWQKQYNQSHHEQYLILQRVAQQKHYIRKKNLLGALTVQQVQAKLKSQKYACYYCFRKLAQRKDGTYVYDLDHTVPVSRTELAPRHDINNVVVACPSCNRRKSDKLPHEWPEGGRLL